MLSLLSYVGAVVSEWTEIVMYCVHKLIKGDKPLKYKTVKQCFYLFILLWLIIIAFITDLLFEIKLSGSDYKISWLDGFYFSFVAYTTIGYGDISDPADAVNFYLYYLILGLAAVSGLSNSCIAAAERLKFRCGRSKCCCCVYIEDDTEENIETLENANNTAEMQA